jgi:hypothetical protein
MKEFQTLGRIDPTSGYLVESCCIFLTVVLRWFTSTLSSQEPLKMNSASHSLGHRKGDLVESVKAHPLLLDWIR